MKNIEKFIMDIVQEIFAAYNNVKINYDSSKNDYLVVMREYTTINTTMVSLLSNIYLKLNEKS